MFDTPSSHPPAPRNRFENLSINTSFIHDWTRSPSPMSMSSSMPATPESFADSPCCLQSPVDVNDHQYATTTAFNFDTFDQHAFSKSFELPHYQMYSDASDNACTMNTTGVYMPSSDFRALPNCKDAPYPSYDHMKPNLAHLELDFTTLMASLPPYTI